MKHILIIFCIVACYYVEAFYKKKFINQCTYINPLIAVDSPNKLHKLIIDGISINTGYDYVPPLLDALLTNKRNKAIFLLQYGAQPNCIKDGITPLRWAINHKDYELIIALLKSQARLDKNDVQRAIDNKAIHKLLSYVLQYRTLGKHYLCKLDKNGLAPIHYAAINGNKEQLDALILTGVPFNILSFEGRTALHYLALNNHTSCIKYVKKNFNCNVSLKDNMGNIPCDLCSNNICKKLLT